MSSLEPLETLFDSERGTTLPLPPELERLYGRLQLPLTAPRPAVISNFVATVDGVVSLNIPGKAAGGPISGGNPHDRMVMGLLRAVADAVIFGAGTLRAASPRHLWTAGYIFPLLAEEYQELRAALGKPEPPLTVIVTASGEIDPDRRVFQSGETPALIVTTADGAERVRERGLSPSVEVAAIGDAGRLSARSILDAVQAVRSSDTLLVEGGPQLLGDFLAEGCLDDLFLTVAPQVAGRDGGPERPGLVSGQLFAPDQPLWAELAGVKRGGSFLFLRYKVG